MTPDADPDYPDTDSDYRTSRRTLLLGAGGIAGKSGLSKVAEFLDDGEPESEDTRASEGHENIAIAVEGYDSDKDPSAYAMNAEGAYEEIFSDYFNNAPEQVPEGRVYLSISSDGQSYPEILEDEAKSAMNWMEYWIGNFNHKMRLEEGYEAKKLVDEESISLQFMQDNAYNAVVPRYRGIVTATSLNNFNNLLEYKQKNEMDILRKDLGQAFLGLVYPSVRELREEEVQKNQNNQYAISRMWYGIQGAKQGWAVVDLNPKEFDHVTDIITADQPKGVRTDRVLDLIRKQIQVTNRPQPQQAKGQNPTTTDTATKTPKKKTTTTTTPKKTTTTTTTTPTPTTTTTKKTKPPTPTTTTTPEQYYTTTTDCSDSLEWWKKRNEGGNSDSCNL